MQTSHAPTFRRAAALLAAVALLAAAAPALALTIVADAKRETRALANHGRLDIIRASGDRKSGTLVHTVTMRKQVRPAERRERPVILVNTKGGNRTEAEYAAYGSAVYRIQENGNQVAIGPAKLTARGRTWTYRFRASEIPNLESFGWAALTSKGKALDVAPNGHYAGARALARTLQAAIAR